MRRAINNEQKEARRQKLIDTAWQLFQERPYGEINVFDVARELGLAKGTVYIYFATKEELFLAIQEQQFAAWFEALDSALALLNAPTPSEIAALLTNSLVERPALLRLFAISHTVLEQNVPYAAVVRLKRLIGERMLHSGRLLETLLPQLLAPGEGPLLLLRAYALVIGVQNLSDHTPVVRQALEQEPDLAVFDIDFAREFRASLQGLLAGWKWDKGELRGGTPS